ncbi:hypothetical protein Tco_0073015 [Tanacetum coccineum]|uniref:Uncharacterized protein n=1 Tax=Tanacetum coccineum TaxID=301880 RepID=A0ABQ4XWW7_9ASTR
MSDIYGLCWRFLDIRKLYASFRSASSGYSKSLSLVIIVYAETTFIMDPSQVDGYHQMARDFTTVTEVMKFLRACWLLSDVLLRIKEDLKGRRKQDVATFVFQMYDLSAGQNCTSEGLGGWLQPFGIPRWKWDEISIDFVTGLPTTQKRHDAIWVVVDGYQVCSFLTYSGRTMKAWGTRLKFSTNIYLKNVLWSVREDLSTLERYVEGIVLWDWSRCWDEYLCWWSLHTIIVGHASNLGSNFTSFCMVVNVRAPNCWDEVGINVLIEAELHRDLLMRKWLL